MKKRLILGFVLLFAMFGCPMPWDGEGPGDGGGAPAFNVSGYSADTGLDNDTAGQEPQEEEVIIPPPEPGDPVEMLEHYITVEMMDENGAVRNEFANGRFYVLAETTGQMMEYALLIGDRELFDMEVSLLREHFLDNGYGLSYASIWADDYSPRENRSSTRNNMQFVWALYKAEDKWGTGTGEYKRLGEEIAGNMVSYNTYLNVLSKGLEWDESEYSISSRMGVADLRWEIMQKLADENPIWRVLLEKTTPLFLECQHEGLFWQEYDIVHSRPVYPEGNATCLTSHMLLAGMYFSEYKTYVPASALNTRMKNEWNSNGIISNAYYMEHLGTGTGNEDMETYALAARNAIELGDCDFALMMKERILIEQVDEIASPIYGSVSRNRQDNGIEDDIDTLIMLLELEDCVPNR